MRFLGEILVNLQSHSVFFAFEIDDRSSPTFVLLCDLERKFPVWRFVSDDVFRFKRWHKANQNDRECRYPFHSDRWYYAPQETESKASLFFGSHR